MYFAFFIELTPNHIKDSNSIILACCLGSFCLWI